MSINMYIYKKVSYYLSWFLFFITLGNLSYVERVIKDLITKDALSFYISFACYGFMLFVFIVLSISVILIYHNEKVYMFTKVKKVFLILLMIAQSIYLILSIINNSFIRPVTYFIVILSFFLANYFNIPKAKNLFIPLLLLIPATVTLMYDFSVFLLFADMLSMIILIAFIKSSTAVRDEDEALVEAEYAKSISKYKTPYRDDTKSITDEEYMCILNEKYGEDEDLDEEYTYNEDEYKQYLNEKYDKNEDYTLDEKYAYDEDKYKQYLNEKYTDNKEEENEIKGPSLSFLIKKKNRYLNTLVIITSLFILSTYTLFSAFLKLEYNRFRYMLSYGINYNMYDNLVVSYVTDTSENVIYDNNCAKSDNENFLYLFTSNAFRTLTKSNVSSDYKIEIKADDLISATVYPKDSGTVLLEYRIKNEKTRQYLLIVKFDEFMKGIERRSRKLNKEPKYDF